MGRRRIIRRIKLEWRKWRYLRPSILAYRGLKIPVRRPGMILEIAEQIGKGDYELAEIAGIGRAVQLGDRILELGSGLGIITALAARATGPGGHVLSFEANPEMVGPTRDFLSEHGIDNVELRHAVLVPDTSLEHTREFHLAGSFAESSLLGAEGRGARGVVQVPAQRLNGVIEEFRPHVLICDIEGGEAELIPALDASALRVAVIEMHPDRLSRRQVADIYDAMARFGLYPEPESPGGTVVLFSRIPDE